MCCVQAFLLNEDLGDSLDSVEALLKKHEDFEKSLSAQEEKITVSHRGSPTVHHHDSYCYLKRWLFLSFDHGYTVEQYSRI